jgi:transposase
MSTKCYNPIKGIDDVIASKIQGWNEYRVATLRGMYDESHSSPLDTSDLDKAVQDLISYRRDLGKMNAESIKTTSSNLSESYQKLKESFSAEERFNRINMISTMFSDRLDALQEANPFLSRKVICNGFVSNGKLVAGQFSVFEGVYNDLLEYYSEAVEEGDMDTANSYKKVLENWGALVSHARMRLRDTEELRLGDKIEYADDTNPDNYNDNKLSELYDASESKREAWQETSDMHSAFGSVGKQVRKLLGSIQRVENGEEVYDDLGFPIMLDPVKAHQSLIEILRGVTSERQMIGLLRNASNSQTWLQPVIEELENNDQLRTQFYVDFKKNFQPYSILLEEVKNGLRTFKTLILNRVNNSLSGQYLTSITLGKQVNPNTSVFNKDGSINWKNLQSLRELVKEYFPSKSVSITPKFYNNKETSWQEKKRVLIKITEALGIDIDGGTLDKIMSSGRDLHKFTDAISELVEFGTDKILNKKELESLDKGEYSLSNRSFKDFIRFSPAGSTAKQGVIREKIDKMLSIVTKNREGLRLESRVRHKDKNGNNVTLFSNVIPSYLGDKMDRIASFVSNNDRQGLRRMIENEFLDSSFFMDKDNGTIFNRWLRDLYESGLDEKDFAANFGFKRFLGTSDNSFENFTSKQHAIDMMAEYFSERQKSPNSQYAYYPVFILGDSGVSKFIKAKRYSAQEILDGLYDVYRQERRRMALTSAANTKLKEGGYSLIENFSSKENEYTALPFLNKDYKSPDGTVGKYAAMIGENPSKQEVVKAIQAYMEEAVNSFKTSLNNLGLLETKEVYNPKTNKKEVQYVYFSQEVNGNKSIDEVIADYYWNTKFATIQQLQLFTIDPAFYKGTKDLQKRYKEIHAPGSVLSLEARDFDGNLYSEDGIERCVYFDDINLNAEVSNPEFMKAIEAKFGKNSPVYKAYTKNTLTDGQGYRTLESYRKVMGMAGKWTQEMENVYNTIKQLRAEYGKDAQIPSDKLTEIANMSVVFQPIKPYMYTIENLAVNSTDKLKIPVQHKYAEAVLIPELLPAGSKLRDMAYWMESKGVDLVGSTKIVKVGGFGSTDISKASNAQELSNALDKAYIHQLSYGDYRIQTNVPEHINSSQLFGTQVRKLIMANIKMDDYHYENYVGGKKVNLGGKYGEVRLNGRNLVSFYNSLIVANILKSYDLFANEVSDIKKLSDKLLQTTINNSRESMDNMLAYSLTGDDKFLVPLFEGALEHDSSAMLFSIFKKRVNKQSIKGGSAVQVSAMGIKGYEESGDLHYVVDPNNPNNILYAECEIPWDISYTDINGKEVALEFSDYCNEDGTLKTDKDGNTLLEKKFPNALSILAYRIPTERDYSMINLRVKRFSQKTAGGTIKVPAQGTTIAGFDFDIDKLYFMRNEYRQRELSSSEVAEIWKEFYETYPNIKDVLKEAREEDTESLNRLYKYWDKAGLPYSYKEAFAQFIADRGYISFESYDFSKSPLDNTRAARNNMLIKLIQERLMDYETFEQRYTPGGFANASKAARTLRELLFGNLEGIVSRETVDFNAIAERAKDSKSDPEPNYDPSDPMTIITYNQQNQVAGKLIGIFANQNTNHAFSSLMSEFTLKDPIRFAGHSYNDLLHAPKGIDVDLNVAEFLAASVDAVKDPVLNFLNLNTITADAGAVLARIGYTTQEIGLLFNQPIIKEICEYSFNNGVTADMAMREVVKNYMGDDTESPKANPDEDFSINKLALNIVNDRVMREQGKNAMDNQSFKADQLKVAELFSQIQTVAGDISQFVTSSKFTASNAVGSTFGDLYSQQMKVKNYIDKFVVKNGKNALSVNMKVTDIIDSPITNNTNLQGSNQEYLESLIENPLAYEQAMYDMNRRAGMLLNSYYPYNTPSYSGARNRLAELTKSNFLDADTINSIHSDMLVYMLSQQEDSLFNGEMPTKDGIPAREYYTKHFAKEVFNTLESNPDLKSLPLFQYMQFVTNEKTGDISMNVQGIGGLAPYQKDELKESWAELLKTEPDLARDLFMYNFYKLGFTFSPLAFMNLAPTELKLAIKVGRKWDSSANDGNGAWVERSYVDFLNDVKEGTVTANSEKFAKQYILNHLDNKRLVLTAKGSIYKLIKDDVYKNNETVSSFTLNGGKLGDDAKYFTIKDSSLPKNVIAFRPCIVIDGVIYMCESGNDKFNVSYDGSITYYKVSQLGTTNKSLQYVSDSESKMKDTESYDSNISGSTKKEDLIPEQNPEKFNREELINKLILYSLKNGNLVSEDVDKFKKDISTLNNSDLIETINDIRVELKEKGLIDNSGNLVC